MRVAAGRTLIRRYALALTPAGAGNEAAVTATAVPPLSGGPGNHDSEATHPLTITRGLPVITGPKLAGKSLFRLPAAREDENLSTFRHVEALHERRLRVL
jgi:hypothetical protein